MVGLLKHPEGSIFKLTLSFRIPCLFAHIFPIIILKFEGGMLHIDIVIPIHFL